jgi:hypothetical protein
MGLSYTISEISLKEIGSGQTLKAHQTINEVERSSPRIYCGGDLFIKGGPFINYKYCDAARH